MTGDANAGDCTEPVGSCQAHEPAGMTPLAALGMPADSWKLEGSKGDVLLVYLPFPALAPLPPVTCYLSGAAGSQGRGR